jgi:hypothetical protein
MDNNLFFMWSLADATHWLIHLPVLGFLMLLPLGAATIFLLMVGLMSAAESIRNQ